MVIHLGLFEPVRTTAGHLTAERVVGDAVRAIGAAVRASDTVRLLGDDRVGVALQHAEPEDLIELRGRIELAVGGVLLPRRVRRDPIRISVVPPPEERVA